MSIYRSISSHSLKLNSQCLVRVFNFVLMIRKIIILILNSTVLVANSTKNHLIDNKIIQIDPESITLPIIYFEEIKGDYFFGHVSIHLSGNFGWVVHDIKCETIIAYIHWTSLVLSWNSARGNWTQIWMSFTCWWALLRRRVEIESGSTRWAPCRWVGAVQTIIGARQTLESIGSKSSALQTVSALEIPENK